MMGSKFGRASTAVKAGQGRCMGTVQMKPWSSTRLGSSEALGLEQSTGGRARLHPGD